MAEQTTNFKFTKDSQDDFFSVETVNNNFDILDNELKKISNKANIITKASGTGTAITLSEVSFVDGFQTTFIVAANNSGTATKINGKNLYKPGSTVAPNLLSGKAVTIWYDATKDCFYFKEAMSDEDVANSLNTKVSIGDDYRPNLLVNGDFQVWKNGEKFINPSGKYTADRWIVENSVDNNIKVLKTNNTLRIEEYSAIGGASAYSNIIQNIEDCRKYIGKTLTLSVNLILDSSITAQIYILDGVTSKGSLAISSSGTYVITSDISYNATSLQVLIRIYRSGLSIGKGMAVNWAKLELNNYTTPFIPRSYNQELLDCYDDFDYKPNLLINGDFQIWQRGTNFNPSNQSYCVDRWKQSAPTANACGIVKTSTGMAFIPLHTNELVFLSQFIENGDRYVNKTLTLSARINGVIYTVTGVLTTANIVLDINNNSSMYFIYDSVNKYIAVTVHTQNETLNIEWIKLERNDHATSMISRPYAEELALCKRYYRTMVHPEINGCVTLQTICSFRGMFDSEMRVPPTMTIPQPYSVEVLGENFYTGLGTAYLGTTKNGYRFDVNDLSNLMIGKGVAWYGAPIIFDAEI